MNGSKYIALLIKPLLLESQQEQVCFNEKLKDSFLHITHRYQITFEELLDHGEYVAYIPLRNDCMDIIACLRLLMQPYQLLFAIGVCELDEDVQSYEAVRSQANVAMKKLEKQRKRLDYRNLNMKIELPKEYETLSISLNMMLLFDCDIQNGWTQKQSDIVYVTYFDGMNQKEVAQHFKVSQPNIHQVLKKANYSLYRDIMNTYRNIFGKL